MMRNRGRRIPYNQATIPTPLNLVESKKNHHTTNHLKNFMRTFPRIEAL